MVARYEGADLVKQAASLFWGVTRNHPFVQGNKRSAVAFAFAFLWRNGFTVRATQEEVVELGLNSAVGEWDLDDVELWLRQRTVPRSPNLLQVKT